MSSSNFPASAAAPPRIDPVRLGIVHRAKVVVVKVGTRVLTGPDGLLDRRRVGILSEQLCDLADSGRQVLMVSSGAVGAGVGKLGLTSRPAGLAQLQAVAAIGQTDLIEAYEVSLRRRGRHAAQVLLTAADLRRRSGYLHVRNALIQIHGFGAIPIINENDSVSVGELQTTFGDNDRLAANVAGLLNRALLVILSDVDGLYDGPPGAAGSQRVSLVRNLNKEIFDLARDRVSLSSKGGMASKLHAAKTAISYGHPTIIAAGRDDQVLGRIFAGEDVGTLFLPTTRQLTGRRRWIHAATHIEGTLTIDDGAVRAVTQRDGSLLAIGIGAVSGEFHRGDIVALCDTQGRELGRGLCNFTSKEIEKIRGLSSDQVAEVLGQQPYEEVIHRDNLVITSV